MSRLPGLRQVAALTAALVISSILAATSATQSGADPIAAKLATMVQANGPADFFVFMKSRADLTPAGGTHAERATFVYEAKKADAERSQAGLRRFLTDHRTPFTPFWIANVIKVHGDWQLMRDVAGRSDVEKVVPDGSYKLVEPVRHGPAAAPNAVEWNIDRIRAPEVWSTFGDRGEGIAVGTIDTGAQFDHPAIAKQYRGFNPSGPAGHDYNWFDPSLVCGAPSVMPCDNIGHGTHVLGTMVGDDGQGNQVGVAPGAKWMAAKGCEFNSCSISALLSAGQWMLAPTDLTGANPRPDLAPNVINNSWGGGPGDPFYQQIVSSWVAAGIFPAFAVGNNGPGCGSAGSPGDYPDSYAVGAFDINNSIAFFSSRGPSAFGGEIKPEVAAPGVGVRSSIPGGGYAQFDGTSMATPHVAATVALIWSASDALRGQVSDTRQLIDSTAVGTEDLSCGGTPGDNNVWGHGRLDAFNAVDHAPKGPAGTLSGTVRSGGQPLPGATVTVQGPLRRTTTTDSQGGYQLPRLSVGTYDLTVSAFGFLAQTAQVVITENETTTRDVDLAAAPRHTVSGHVRDGANAPISGATVSFPGTPLPAVTSGADGGYTVPDVPEGTYDVLAEAAGCRLPQRLQVTVTGDTTVDFTLPAKGDRFGHICETTPSSYVDAGTVLPLSGLDVSLPVELPFPVNLYGQSHLTVNVTSKAFLSFTDPQPIFTNTEIPSSLIPNAAIYAFWDDLSVDPLASVRTEVLGSAPNRTFVLEWRDVSFFGVPDRRISAEILLAENGRITLQYKGLGDDPVERGGAATVGIENQTGTDAVQFSFNTPALSDGTAIVFTVPGTGLVRGRVTDANDHLPVAGATVTAHQADQPDQAVQTDGAGGYAVRARIGDLHLRVEKSGYPTVDTDLNLPNEDGLGHDVELRSGRLGVAPGSLELVVPPGETRQRTLTISNTGTADLSWKVNESGGSAARLSASVSRPTGAAFDANALTTKGFPARQPVAPAAPGDVLRSWPTTGQQLGWGVGYRNGPWISDAALKTNGHFAGDGTAGQTWPAPWTATFNADMAYVPGRNLVCQVNVGGDNGIYCWNPETGTVAETIVGAFPWTSISQRGLAYRPDDDTFYVGGWNQGIVYNIKGLSHSDRGAVIGQCGTADPAISGLGWNAAFGMLWEATNSPTDTIYGLNPDTCQTLKTIAPPDNVAFTGAGIETDPAGNLWTVSQGAPSTAYLIDSGVPEFTDVPWLRVTPDSGTTAPGASSALKVDIDYGATVVITANAGRNPTVSVPVKLIVPAYQAAINAGGVPFKDANADSWVVDRAFTPGGFGYLANKSTVVKTTKPIAGTADQPLYQNLREGAFEYRFDNVPNGTYAIDLKFAELKSIKPNTRLFDVIVEGNLLIPALDIAGDAGSFAALDRTLFVNVTDGQLNVRFISRKGDPIVNAIRVTHRPDRIT